LSATQAGKCNEINDRYPIDFKNLNCNKTVFAKNRAVESTKAQNHSGKQMVREILSSGSDKASPSKLQLVIIMDDYNRRKIILFFE
jgi:hypothetical protein